MHQDLLRESLEVLRNLPDAVVEGGGDGCQMVGVWGESWVHACGGGDGGCVL